MGDDEITPAHQLPRDQATEGAPFQQQQYAQDVELTAPQSDAQAATAGSSTSPAIESGYLLLIDPRNTVRLTNVRQVKSGSVHLFLDGVREHGYSRTTAPTVYEPDPTIRAVDMSEEQRARAMFPIRDGAHRICGLALLMADPTETKYTDDYRVEVRVVPKPDLDLVRKQDAITDNAVTDNAITRRTATDEYWAILGVRNILVTELVGLSQRWQEIGLTTKFKTSNMPRSEFPSLTVDEFCEIQRIMK